MYKHSYMNLQNRMILVLCCTAIGEWNVRSPKVALMRKKENKKLQKN